MKTIKELCEYLEKENYQFNGIGIGKHHTQDGVIIEQNGNAYDFCSIERGVKHMVRSFACEEDLVQYAFAFLTENDAYRMHLAAWTWSEEEIRCAEKELQKLGIHFKRNDIPGFSKGKTAYRIYVFGKDAMRAAFLKDKYWQI